MGRYFRLFDETKDTQLPRRGTERSAGYDFYAPDDVTLRPGEMVIVKSNVTAYMEPDEYLDLRVRSSLGKRKISFTNGCGVVDADYSGFEIGFLMLNLGDEEYHIHKGDRIAQGVFTKYLVTDNDEPTSSTRTGGYGSTGK